MDDEKRNRRSAAGVCESLSGVGLNQTRIGASAATAGKASGSRCAQVCRREERSWTFFSVCFYFLGGIGLEQRVGMVKEMLKV